MNDYFTEGMRKEFIQEPSYSLSLDKMTVVASCPVTDDDASIGVLAGRANLESLNALMVGRAGLGQTGETYLIGSNHRLLTDLRRPGYSIPEYLHPHRRGRRRRSTGPGPAPPPTRAMPATR